MLLINILVRPLKIERLCLQKIGFIINHPNQTLIHDSMSFRVAEKVIVLTLTTIFLFL